jgi:fumarate hydratase class II
MTATRVEHDSPGPVDELWGAKTQRSPEHLEVAGPENPGAAWRGRS